METLETEDKTESITFMVTPSMRKQLDKLMKKKRWRMAAFIRVALAKELQVQKEGK